jgi:hypothetical protein
MGWERVRDLSLTRRLVAPGDSVPGLSLSLKRHRTPEFITFSCVARHATLLTRRKFCRDATIERAIDRQTDNQRNDKEQRYLRSLSRSPTSQSLRARLSSLPSRDRSLRQTFFRLTLLARSERTRREIDRARRTHPFG